MSVSPTPAVTGREIVAITLRDCADMLTKQLKLDDPAAIAKRGYGVPYVDPDGRWATRRIEGGEVRIGDAPAKPGCRLYFEGAGAEPIYEATVSAFREQNFSFANGRRAKPEKNFVLDTLIGTKGPVAIVSMFRPNLPDATMFAINVFPLDR